MGMNFDMIKAYYNEYKDYVVGLAVLVVLSVLF
jgi:hypothetical protein